MVMTFFSPRYLIDQIHFIFLMNVTILQKLFMDGEIDINDYQIMMCRLLINIGCHYCGITILPCCKIFRFTRSITSVAIILL